MNTRINARSLTREQVETIKAQLLMDKIFGAITALMLVLIVIEFFI